MSSVNLYKSSGSSLFINSDSKYDRWLQEHYLPSGFNIDLSENRQKSLKPFWKRRIRCDFGELCHIFSLFIIAIVVFSTFIFFLYLKSECSFIKRNNETTTRSLSSFGSTNRTTEPNCNLVSVVVYLNLGFSYTFLLLLLCYMMHLVEYTPDFMWYPLEICYGALYLTVLLVASLITCIATNATTIVVLSIAQMGLDAVFIILRYYKCQSGRPAQDMEEDPDGDYIRKMKYLFHHNKEQKTTRAQKMRLFYSSKDGTPEQLMCSKQRSKPLVRETKETSSKESRQKVKTIVLKQRAEEKINSFLIKESSERSKSFSLSRPTSMAKSQIRINKLGSGSAQNDAESSSSKRSQ